MKKTCILILLVLCGCMLAVPAVTAQVTHVSTSGTAGTVASVYERVSDGIAFNRSMNDVTAMIKDTHTNLLFRGFFRWEPVPESSSSAMTGYPANYAKTKYSIGYTFAQLKDSISQIKAASPDTKFIGAVAAQRLNRIEYNDLTHASYTQSQTWAMAFDPAKYNISDTKQDFQCTRAKALGWISASTACPSGYNPSSVSAYYPDITNTQYQAILVSSAEKQIDLGADGIWIDELYSQANLIQTLKGNANDPGVKSSYLAASSVVDQIHAYGKTKYNKQVLVGTWYNFLDLPYSPPAVDFVTATPASSEITGTLSDTKWTSVKTKVTNKLGAVPVYAYIDWGGAGDGAGAPMTAFSQSLTPAQQSAWLKTADPFFTGKGITFVYPLHGGTFPASSARLSFGKFNVYDSAAPEFGTYSTIVALGQAKA